MNTLKGVAARATDAAPSRPQTSGSNKHAEAADGRAFKAHPFENEDPAAAGERR